MSDRAEHVYEGKPDNRYEPDVKTSRFRPRYRALSDAEKALHDEIKSKAAEMEELYERVSAGRYRALAITALEESVMWVVKELTA